MEAEQQALRVPQAPGLESDMVLQSSASHKLCTSDSNSPELAKTVCPQLLGVLSVRVWTYSP